MSRIIIAGGQSIGNLIFNQISQNTDHEIVCLICRSDDNGMDGVFPSLLKKGLERGIPILQLKSINEPYMFNTIKKLDCDVLLSAGNNQIFRKNLIELFDHKLGIINIHYAPLPRYSGYWPEMWAIWNEEKEFGVTIHYIDKGIDTGEIICQQLFEISTDETRKSLYEKCVNVGIDLFKKKCDLFLNKKAASYKQDESKRIYFRRELPNNGLLDLAWEKKKIERFIRATSFYPFIGAKIKINENIYSIVDKNLPFFKPHYIGETLT